MVGIVMEVPPLHQTHARKLREMVWIMVHSSAITTILQLMDTQMVYSILASTAMEVPQPTEEINVMRNVVMV